jgi:prephenate dehydratase
MPKRLAFFGPAGTHTEQACVNYDAEAILLPYMPISEVVAAVESGEADECVIPIENSLQGSVTETLDILVHQSSLSIRHELVLPIRHFLVANRGAAVESVDCVYSHPQALAQCREFLATRLPNAEVLASLSTAAAVEDMLGRGPRAAAIATRRAAELHGCVVIAEGIEDIESNMTRFVVLAPTDHPRTGADKTSACFSFDEDAPGILHGVLAEFANRGINLAKIESRPTRQSLGRYIFLIDFEGHRQDAAVREVLARIEEQVSMLKIFGSYPTHRA